MHWVQSSSKNVSLNQLMPIQYTGLVLAPSPETSIIQPFTERCCCRNKRTSLNMQLSQYETIGFLLASSLRSWGQFVMDTWTVSVHLSQTSSSCNMDVWGSTLGKVRNILSSTTPDSCLSHPVSIVGTLSPEVRLLKRTMDRSPPLSAERGSVATAARHLLAPRARLLVNWGFDSRRTFPWCITDPPGSLCGSTSTTYITSFLPHGILRDACLIFLVSWSQIS